MSQAWAEFIFAIEQDHRPAARRVDVDPALLLAEPRRRDDMTVSDPQEPRPPRRAIGFAEKHQPQPVNRDVGIVARKEFHKTDHRPAICANGLYGRIVCTGVVRSRDPVSSNLPSPPPSSMYPNASAGSEYSSFSGSSA